MSFIGDWQKVAGTTQFGTASHHPRVVGSQVQTGDLLVAVCTLTNYLLPEGKTRFDPANFLMPPGWTLIDWRVVSPGGDPRRVALINVLAAAIASPSLTPVDSFVDFRSRVPYYEQDQDPGSFGFMYPGISLAMQWRGEKNLTGWDVATGGPSHVASTIDGSSRDGEAQCAKLLTEGATFGYGMWVKADPPTGYPVGDPRTLHPRPIGLGQKENVTAYAWDQATGASTPHSTKLLWLAQTFSASPTVYPLPPTLLAPAAGAMLDLDAQGVPLSWLHRPALAGPQAGYALSWQRAGAGVMWWNAAAETWSSSTVKNPGTLSGLDLPESAFGGTVGLQNTFTVHTYGSNGELSAPSAAATVVSVQAPSASASFIGADPTGTLPSLRPSVAISGTSPGGYAITRWSAVMFDASNGRELIAQDGDFPAGANVVTWAPEVNVPNGTRVQAFIRVQQAGGAWSPVQTTEVVTDVDVPGAPEVGVTTGAHPTSGAPSAQVRVEFPWQTDGYAWASRGTLLRLERLDAGAWVTVAEIALPPGRTSAILDDYAASAGTLQYRARGEGQAVDGSRLVGGWGYSTPVTVMVPGEWLIDPARPEAAVKVGLVADDARSLELRSVRMAALGRDEELVAAGTPLLESGQVTLRVNTPEHRARVLDLLTSGAVLKLTFCPERDVFDDGRRQAAESLWLRPVGDVATSRVVTRGPWALRHVAFSFVTQRPPVIKSAEVA